MWRSAGAGRGTLMRRQFSRNRCRSITCASINDQCDCDFGGGGKVMSFKNLVRLLAVAIFSLCVASTSVAQKPAGAGPPPNNNPNLDDRARQVDEGRLRSAETDARSEERS